MSSPYLKWDLAGGPGAHRALPKRGKKQVSELTGAVIGYLPRLKAIELTEWRHNWLNEAWRRVGDSCYAHP